MTDTRIDEMIEILTNINEKLGNYLRDSKIKSDEEIINEEN